MNFLTLFIRGLCRGLILLLLILPGGPGLYAGGNSQKGLVTPAIPGQESPDRDLTGSAAQAVPP
ncbi:MAG: hypothetical protein LBB77_11075, partial [Treponema sp.]|nr:hypothetical protein [Treponema sp.]